MKTTAVNAADFARSVIAVPPLALGADLTTNAEENDRILDHLRAGGVTSVLYGGNANFYNLPTSRLVETCHTLADGASEDTWVIPSVGPDYGRLMDAAPLFRETSFPVVLLLPLGFPTTPAGVIRAINDFVQAFGRPAIAYLKSSTYARPEDIAALVDAGTLCGVKYAVPREDFASDPYLDELVKIVDRRRIVSGFGELPAVPHMRTYDLAGFTSGADCIAPGLSGALLKALRSSDKRRQTELLDHFTPLEALRNKISPIRVLHEAVALSGLAQTGPILPMLSNLAEEDQPAVARAAKELLALEMQTR